MKKYWQFKVDFMLDATDFLCYDASSMVGNSIVASIIFSTQPNLSDRRFNIFAAYQLSVKSVAGQICKISSILPPYIYIYSYNIIAYSVVFFSIPLLKSLCSGCFMHIQLKGFFIVSVYQSKYCTDIFSFSYPTYGWKGGKK